MKRIDAIIKFAENALTITDNVLNKDILEHPAYEVAAKFVPGAKAILEIGQWLSELQRGREIPKEAIALVCREAEIPECECASIKSANQLNEVLTARGINNPERLFEREVNRLFSQAKYPELTQHLVDQHETELRYLEQQFEVLQRLLQEGFYHLIPIEKVLDALPQTHHAREPRFFRTSGPLAVDFEHGYVHRRPEVDQLRERLAVEPTVLLNGAGASGKSVIAWQVSYELWREGWTVYLLSLTQQVNRMDLQREIERLGNGEHLVVIEDVHLNPTVINELLQAAGSNWPKLLLTSRPIDFASALRKAFIENQLERQPRLDIEPSDTNEPIIHLFANKQGIELTPDLNEALTEISGGSLWVLAYALKAVKDTGQITVERESVLMEVERDLKKLWDDHDDIRYPKVLIALSILYRQESPTDAYFLEQVIPGVRDVLNHLSRLGEVREFDSQRRLYGLPHSALADLYFEFTTSSAWKDPIYSNTRSFLRDYLTSDYALNWFAIIGRSKEESQVIANLQVQDIKKLTRLVEEMEVLWIATRAIEGINNTDPSKGQALVAELNLSRFAKRIEATEKLRDAASAIKAIQDTDPSKGQTLWAMLDLSCFAKRIDETEDPEDATIAIETIQDSDPSKGQALWATLDLSRFTQHIEEMEELWRAARIITSIHMTDPAKGQALVAELNLARFAKRIDETEGHWEAAHAIEVIQETDPAKGQALWAMLNLSRFAQRIDETEDLKGAIRAIEIIRKIDPSKGQALVAELNLARFAKRIDETEDLKGAIRAIEIIRKIDPSKGQALVAELNLARFAKRIDETEDPEDAAIAIETIQDSDPSKGQALIAELNLARFAKRIEATEKLEAAASAIKTIQEADPSKGQALVAELNLARFAKRIDVTEDPREAAIAIKAIQEADPSKGQALWAKLNLSHFAKRIDVTEDPWQAAIAIKAIQEADPSKGQALWAMLNLSRFAQRIDGTEYLLSAASAIKTIQEADPSKGRALVAELNLPRFARCIDEMEVLWLAGRAIKAIQEADPSKGQALVAELNLARFAKRIEATEKLEAAASAIKTIQEADPSKGQALVGHAESNVSNDD
ncbi:MAG: hypothetical protein JAY90_19580 [Candidatus Thiodiazotropha lotti]|nr:hypothetical protein [Candidatus Thiodiazotropha lotti]